MLYKWNHIIHIGNEERMLTVIATPRMKKRARPLRGNIYLRMLDKTLLKDVKEGLSK